MSVRDCNDHDSFAAGDDSRRFRRELGCPFGSEHSDRCWPLVEVGETIDQRERYELVAIATEDGLAHKYPSDCAFFWIGRTSVLTWFS